jgi:hypothetical protein
LSGSETSGRPIASDTKGIAESTVHFSGIPFDFCNHRLHRMSPLALCRDCPTKYACVEDGCARVKAAGFVQSGPCQEQITLRAPPKPVGAYSLTPDFFISYHVTHYPNPVFRFVQRWLLGIYWRKL